MADVELVIKIPEEVKNRLCFGVTYSKDIQVVCEALNDGTPLPKGHGRLIDADEFKNYCQTGLENVKPLFKTEKYCKLAIDITQGIIADVDEMETIIEADKEVE